MKKIIALLSSLLIISIPNMLVAQEVNVTPAMIQKFETGCRTNSGADCSNLGVLYANGQNVKQDYFKAVEYSIKTCNLNDGGGCSNLGFAYAKGEGVKLDKQKAKELFGKACDLKAQVGCDNYRKMSE